MFQIMCLASETREFNTLFARYLIGPFKKNQSLTIANSLRRILLSEVQGLAITAVRIPDINHEFSTIDNVREDVIDVLLNLKKIVLKGPVDTCAFATLSFRGPGIITAKDLDLPEGITLVEPNQYIASATTNEIVEMEFLIQSGEGYSIDSSLNQAPYEFLSIDPVYMPVLDVNYWMEYPKNRSKKLVESLVFEVHTDGSITPAEAISISSDILIRVFEEFKLCDFTPHPEPLESIPLDDFLEDEKLEALIKKQEDLSDDEIGIERLNLSIRSYKCLKRENIHTIADLTKYSLEDLLNLKNFGRKSANEVSSKLREIFGKSLY